MKEKRDHQLFKSIKKNDHIKYSTININIDLLFNLNQFVLIRF